MNVKKFNQLFESDSLLFGQISRLLSDYFYPNVSKNTFPIKCDGFRKMEEHYEVYFSVWDDINNKYKSGPITTILVDKNLL